MGEELSQFKEARTNAYKYRLKGLINHALQLEALCDRMYDSMSDEEKAKAEDIENDLLLKYHYGGGE